LRIAAFSCASTSARTTISFPPQSVSEMDAATLELNEEHTGARSAQIVLRRYRFKRG
jgi:hypothetical protein